MKSAARRADPGRITASESGGRANRPACSGFEIGAILARTLSGRLLRREGSIWSLRSGPYRCRALRVGGGACRTRIALHVRAGMRAGLNGAKPLTVAPNVASRPGRRAARRNATRWGAAGSGSAGASPAAASPPTSTPPPATRTASAGHGSAADQVRRPPG
ncbi:MAG: hypothetical protein R6V44_06775, partial [Paracoccaceae bacterium]